MSTFDRYIGLEFEDKGRGPRFDCWGLVRLFNQQEFALEMPSYVGAYDTCMDGQEIESLMRHERETTWKPVQDGQCGDVVILRMQGRPWHCGVMLDQVRFLHIMPGINSVIERITAPLWVRRIDGIYRHVSLIKEVVQ